MGIFSPVIVWCLTLSATPIMVRNGPSPPLPFQSDAFTKWVFTGPHPLSQLLIDNHLKFMRILIGLLKRPAKHHLDVHDIKII